MSSAPVAASRIARLILQDFRTYASLDLTVSRPLVALVGENGAGKTNVLEAISLFMPGRGLRRAELAEMARKEGLGSFAVSVTLDAPYGEHRLGTGIEHHNEGSRASRVCRIDGMSASSPTAFAEYLRIVWLTP
ncbi:MAG: replication/repair protein RecF, partial [Microvirga sp.]|nr:replication/repair protein RecF [Microvirga sp.]